MSGLYLLIRVLSWICFESEIIERMLMCRRVRASLFMIILFLFVLVNFGYCCVCAFGNNIA